MIDINKEIKSAMLAKDSVRLESLRALKTAIMIAETEKGAEKLNDNRILKIIQKLVKQRKDASEIYLNQGREDLAKEELDQLLVLESFLPEQISNEELTKIIKKIILDLGAESMSDMGQVMGVASKQLSGKADGKKISEIVGLILKNNKI
ncbi:MAG: glutamyl-tRNA amidotransferase [Flavobacteriales bacterium]|nr:glutamyl-tRNA amidotransferase [Flavobacteriales bacterium]